MLHRKSLVTLLAGAYVNTVAASETVKHVNLLNKTHSGESLANCRN